MDFFTNDKRNKIEFSCFPNTINSAFWGDDNVKKSDYASILGDT
jgi:hypothetical protein